jgi:GxxExxY protein
MTPNDLDKLVSPHLNVISRNVIGAAIEVHRNLGPGYLEDTYQAALAIELRRRGISFAQQVEHVVRYLGEPITTNRLDLVVEEELVVELKAVEKIHPVHRAPLLSYIRAGGFELGLLINFNVPRLVDGVSRVVLTTVVGDPAWARSSDDS